MKANTKAKVHMYYVEIFIGFVRMTSERKETERNMSRGVLEIPK